MKKRMFVSIIWGYHKQFYGLSPTQNYQLVPFLLAKKAGYQSIVYLIHEQAPIENDPQFDPDTIVVRSKGMWDMIRFLWTHRHDLVYANSVIWQNFLLVPFLCRRAVFMAHDSIERRSRIKQWIENCALKFYWRVRVIAPGEKVFLIGQKIPLKKIFVAPMAIDTETFHPKPGEQKDLVFLGNVTPDNDVPTILKAFQIVLQQEPETKLHIIGEIRTDDFYSTVENLNLSSAIVEHGYLSHAQIAELLPTFSILVSSVLSCGQHLSVFEAALSGLGLCLPDVMQFNSVFTNAALFHKRGDVEILAKNILFYLDHPDQRISHNTRARTIITSTYTPKQTEQKLRELFQF